MMNGWWLIWVVFMFVFLISPVGYGWGYRRWGPPYPRYVQRRRGQRAEGSGTSAQFNHYAWGVGGDFIWAMLVIWIIWAIWAATFWWR